MSVSWIGPVAVELWDPAIKWTSSVSGAGTRAGTIAGFARWDVAKQLLELVDNPDRFVTIGADTGVLEYVWAGDEQLRGLRGWCLLQSADISANVDHSLGDDALVPLSIGLVSVGDHRQVVATHSARALDNSHGLVGVDVVVAPLAVSDGNPAFTAEPGGTVATRAYDADHAGGLFGNDVDARTLQLRLAAPATLPGLLWPTVEDDAQPPSWVTNRGGECRAYDIAEGRAVYGPSHPLVEPSDLVLENGLTRAWCGARGIVPYFTVASLVDGAWVQCGHVLLVDETTGPVLERARLVKVTPGAVTAALHVRGIGDVFVSLRRGERMLRVQHGTTRAPTVATPRRAEWRGLPPTIDGPGAATVDAGEFGTGLDASGFAPLFQWPAASTQTAWSIRGAFVAPGDSDALPTSGMFTLLDVDSSLVATMYFDADDSTFKAEIDTDSVVTPAVTFDDGDVVTWVARFDTSAGLALTVATPDATVRAADATAITPAGTTPITTLGFFGTPTDLIIDWGDGDWGDGTWGGAVLPTAGVVDEILVFAGRLTDDQADALVDQAHQLASLPSDPRPVWYAPFNSTPLPAGDALASGRVVETDFDDNDLKRFAAALGPVIAVGLGVRSSSPVAAIDIAAGLADTAPGNTASDMHEQFAAQSQQETRIR